jgi:hypothetical protein
MPEEEVDKKTTPATSEQAKEVDMKPSSENQSSISDEKGVSAPAGKVTVAKQSPRPRKRTRPAWLAGINWLKSLLVLVIVVGIFGLLLFLLLVDRKNAIDLIKAFIAWPVVIAIAILVLSKPLAQFLYSLGQNFQTVKVSVLQFALEVSKASQFIPTWADVSSGFDLRLIAGDEAPSSGESSLFEQFRGSDLLDYVLIDIGDGKQWLTSRLFIFAIMLERMRGLRCLVFVQTTSDAYQRFLGTASPTGYATRYHQADSEAESGFWGRRGHCVAY